MPPHDAETCRCERDDPRVQSLRRWGAAVATADDLKDPECQCGCPACSERRGRHAKMIAMAKLEMRLLKANIDPRELADLQWLYLCDGLEAWFRRVSREVFAEMLSEMTLTTRTYLESKNVIVKEKP